MLGLLKRFRATERKHANFEFDTPLAVERPCIVIGDIHGRADLLLWILQKIAEIHMPDSSADIVFVGDLVDRGENSADVLQQIQDLTRSDGEKFTCLMGNHEKMLIDFLDRPGEKGRLWLRNGGLQTLASFGVGGVTDVSGEEALQKAAGALGKAMGPTLERWLRALPLTYTNGNLVCVHAAADPAVPIAAQSQSTLLWGHRDFFRIPRSDGLWVAHGHTIVDQPRAENGRISVDTGAYYSGDLTAAVLAPGEAVRFIGAT